MDFRQKSPKIIIEKANRKNKKEQLIICSNSCKKPELLRTYRIFNDCLINPIIYALDLYFEETKRKMILKTDAVCTKYKQNLLKCEFTEKGEVEGICLEEQEDDWYL